MVSTHLGRKGNAASVKHIYRARAEVVERWGNSSENLAATVQIFDSKQVSTTACVIHKTT